MLLLDKQVLEQFVQSFLGLQSVGIAHEIVRLAIEFGKGMRLHFGLGPFVAFIFANEVHMRLSCRISVDRIIPASDTGRTKYNSWLASLAGYCDAIADVFRPRLSGRLAG